MENKIKLVFLMTLLFAGRVVNAQTYDTLNSFGSYWKYQDNGINLDSVNWKDASYNDGAWYCGPAPLGYGDVWIMTCINSGCATQNNCNNPSGCSVKATSYFRRKLNINDITPYDSVLVEGIIDDGLVLYVNGSPAWYYGMPTTCDHTTWSTNNISGVAETTITSSIIPISLFSKGNNMLAVELHQRAATSSDATMDLRLSFRKKSATSNITKFNKYSFSVFPNPTTNSFTIETTSAITIGKINISLTDNAGRVVYQKEMESDHNKIQVEPNLCDGIYFGHMSGLNIDTTFKIQISK